MVATDIPVPSEEIQTIVDKTAQFVAKLGADFEKRIIENEKNNPKFSFLKQQDPYFAFYQKRIKDFRELLGPEAAIVTEPEIKEEFVTIPEKPVIEETEVISQAPKHGPTSLAQRIIAVARKNKGKEIETPTPEQYMVDIPDDVTALDLDIIKLTAQFVAKNGHQFQIGLLNKEHKNPQFDFLKQNHDFHNYFLGLVESYTRVILPPKGLLQKLRTDYLDKQVLLDKIIAKHEWEKQQEKIKKAAEEQAHQESIANSLIDWHDFVIVETIDFYEDEEMTAPQQFDIQQQQQQQQQQQPTGQEMESEDMEMEVEEPQQHEMRIRKDYVKPQDKAKPKSQVCPKCLQDIPVEQMDEHMKMELQDPKYRIQRQAMMEKAKGVVSADEDIGKNSANFAQQGADKISNQNEKERKDDTQKTSNVASKSETLPKPPRLEEKPSEPVSSVPAPTYAPPGVRPLPRGVPPPPGIAPNFKTSDGNPSKKQKTEANLIPEDQFLAKHKGPITITIQVPRDEKADYKMQGQNINLTFDLKTTVSAVKDKIAEVVGIAANKQKLKADGLPFFKDQQTLASYNITNGTVMQLGFKVRGGKK